MRLVVTGARGQVGWELARSLAPLGEVVALDRGGLDLSRLDTIATTLRELKPDVIVNAAAYTAVDRAEREEALAAQVNGQAVGILAGEAARSGALLIHYSTDYVFDGQKGTAYVESDPVAPLNAYGRSKLAGEQQIAASSCDWLTFRTTWVYSARGNNFLQTILRLAAERDSLSIVEDQHGAPTSARYLSDVTAHVILQAQAERSRNRFASGLYHLTASGRTTWHGFASSIVEAVRAGHVDHPLKAGRIDAIRSDEYVTAAARPKNSLLDNASFSERFGLYRPDWREGMETTLMDAMSR